VQPVQSLHEQPLESVKDDLLRMCGKTTLTVRKVKWAIDTKVQQGGFPGNEDIARVRAGWAQGKGRR
jgi:hypothetical protein